MPDPSVGRVVHYVAYGTPGGEFPAGKCRAAVIAEVGTLIRHRSNDDREVSSDEDGVDLVVLNPQGIFFDQGLRYDEDRRPGTWHWPERVD